jgi:hypothetical protein
MFVGHLAVAFGAKTVTPRIPLGWLVAAAFGLDLIWPLFLLAGLEHVRIDPGNTAFTPLAFDDYPWSHSLMMAVVWGLIAGVLAASRLKNHKLAGGSMIAAVAVSHWILDFMTHRPDLPLWPGGPMAGWGLWNSVAATFLVEGLMFVIAIAAYRQRFRSSDRVGRWAFAALIVFTGLIWASGPWSPPPPSASAVAVVALAMWLFPFWAAWIERHRHPQNRDADR